jgi:hypothetical protein
MSALTLSWTDFKAELARRSGPAIEYVETSNVYFVWFAIGVVEINCVIVKSEEPSEEQVDFEENYQP